MGGKGGLDRARRPVAEESVVQAVEFTPPVAERGGVGGNLQACHGEIPVAIIDFDSPGPLGAEPGPLRPRPAGVELAADEDFDACEARAKLGVGIDEGRQYVLGPAVDLVAEFAALVEPGVDALVEVDPRDRVVLEEREPDAVELEPRVWGRSSRTSFLPL